MVRAPFRLVVLRATIPPPLPPAICENRLVSEPPRKPMPAEDREVDYLICQNCMTPSYIFEMEAGQIQEAQCLVCGNDEPAQFSKGEDAGSEQS